MFRIRTIKYENEIMKFLDHIFNEREEAMNFMENFIKEEKYETIKLFDKKGRVIRNYDHIKTKENLYA